MMITYSTPLPPLTEYVQDKAADVWGKLINQCTCAEYYLAKFPKICHSAEYQAVGEKMFGKFPGIKQEGTTPWVSIAIANNNAKCTLVEFEIQIPLPSSKKITRIMELSLCTNTQMLSQ